MACTETTSPSDYNALYEYCVFVGQCWQKIPKYQHSGLHWNWRIQCSEILLYVDPCWSVIGYTPVGGTLRLHLQGNPSPEDLDYSEDGSRKLHRKVSNYLPVDRAAQPVRLIFIKSVLKMQITYGVVFVFCRSYSVCSCRSLTGDPVLCLVLSVWLSRHVRTRIALNFTFQSRIISPFALNVLLACERAELLMQIWLLARPK